MHADQALRYTREKLDRYKRLDMYDNIMREQKAKKRGGTLRHKLAHLENWQTATCTHCYNLFHKHYYTHDCRWRTPHRWCYECLKKHGRCKRCGQMHTRILKN